MNTLSTITPPVYLDYAATTPVDPRVAQALADCLTQAGYFANPASSHAPGRAARAQVEAARAELAALLNCQAQEIVFTSGATEADNLAIKGVAQFYEQKGRHIISEKTAHKAVVDAVKTLEKQGWSVTWLSPENDGVITTAQVEQAIQPDTVLVSLLHANNETGVLNDIAAISQLTRERGVLLHVDAAQSVGKIPLDLAQLPIDLLALSAHKFYGPKGIGALFVRRQPRANVSAQLHGGGHEQGLRSGTLATHQIVGMGVAAQLARQQLPEEQPRLTALRQRLWQGIAHLGELNGHSEQRLPGILNVSFADVEGESLLLAVEDLAVSSGAACTSASREPSYVLRALGRNDQQAQSSLRFSVGRFTTPEEVDYAITRVVKEIERLQAIGDVGSLLPDRAKGTASKVKSAVK